MHTTIYGDIKIKHYSKVTYLDCELDESLLAGWGKLCSMALKVINKINSRLKFLYNRKNCYLLYSRDLSENMLYPTDHLMNF